MMTEAKKVGIGLIGCGSRLTGVIERTIKNCDQFEVVALSDVSEEALSRAKERLHCPDANVYADHRDLSNDPAIDWVCVGSWNAFHKEHILGALEANKHVFTEKPLTTNIEDCVILKKAIDKHSGLFSMGFVLRYAPFYRRIKELIAEGVLGTLISFEFNETIGPDHGGYIMSDWRRKREWAGTHLLEKCCHDFDLTNWITDSAPMRAASFGGLDFFTPTNAHQVDRVGPHANGLPAYHGWQKQGIYTRQHKLNPFTSDKDIIDNQVVILEYANGVRATFHTNLNTAISERRMYLCGTEGTIRGDVLTGEIEYKRISHEKPLMRETTVGGGHGGADGIMSNALRDSMLKGAAPLVGLDDGIRSAVACFGVDQAMDSGTVVDLRSMWDQVGIAL
jgi:predicted dehydrogenase